MNCMYPLRRATPYICTQLCYPQGSRSSAALVVNTTKHLPHVEWSSDGGLGQCDGHKIPTWRIVAEPAIGKLPLAGATALASKFLFQSSKRPDRSNRPSKNVEKDGNGRRKDVAHLPTPRRRQPPNVPSSHALLSNSPTAGKQRRSREHSQSTRGPSVSSPPMIPQPSRGSSAESGAHRRWKRPIRDERGYDSGYASGSDQTNDRHPVRRGPQRSPRTMRRSK